MAGAYRGCDFALRGLKDGTFATRLKPACGVWCVWYSGVAGRHCCPKANAWEVESATPETIKNPAKTETWHRFFMLLPL
jgi:hypothetical protein